MTVTGEEIVKSLDGSLFWALEHSQYSEDQGKYPWHIGYLSTAIESNLRDCQHNNRGPNKWQIVYIGPDMESCSVVCEVLIKAKREGVPP